MLNILQLCVINKAESKVDSWRFDKMSKFKMFVMFGTICAMMVACDKKADDVVVSEDSVVQPADPASPVPVAPAAEATPVLPAPVAPAVPAVSEDTHLVH